MAAAEATKPRRYYFRGSWSGRKGLENPGKSGTTGGAASSDGLKSAKLQSIVLTKNRDIAASITVSYGLYIRERSRRAVRRMSFGREGEASKQSTQQHSSIIAAAQNMFLFLFFLFSTNAQMIMHMHTFFLVEGRGTPLAPPRVIL